MNIASRCGVTPVRISVTAFDVYNYKVYLDRGIPEGLGKKKSKGEKKKRKNKKKKGKKGGLFGKKKGDEEAEEEEPEEEPEDEDFAPEESQDDFASEMEEIKAYINMGASTFDICIRRQSESRDLLGFTRSVPFSATKSPAPSSAN